jgi:hypothetical protein
MLASIWLQVVGEQGARVRSLIADMAAEHGTLPFEPHLTVCGGPDLDPARWDKAADYVRQSGLLPLTVVKARISCSTAVWSRAVVIDVEDGPEIAAFRAEMSRLAGAAVLAPPHISLLYTMGEHREQPGWAGSEPHLRTIAEQCAERLASSVFVVGDPVVVVPDGDWANIRSWKVVRSL